MDLWSLQGKTERKYNCPNKAAVPGAHLPMYQRHPKLIPHRKDFEEKMPLGTPSAITHLPRLFAVIIETICSGLTYE